MNPDLYFEIYYHLTLGRFMPTDEAKCVMSDLMEAMSKDQYLDAWEWVSDYV